MAASTFILVGLSLMAVLWTSVDASAVAAIHKRSSGNQFHPEDPCSREGGMCVLASVCPNLHETSGLCPQQEALGAECCYGLPTNVRECSARGGECVPDARCGRAPRDLEAECPAEHVCCVFV